MNNSSNKYHSFEQVKKDVNDLLENHLQKRTREAGLLHKDYEQLWQSIISVHRAGGKRTRPYLFVFIYEAFAGGNYSSVLSVAGAIELLHAAMLIHDDVIDRDFMRHGELNIGGIYERKYSQAKEILDTKHFANSAAILAGDLLISDAYQLVMYSSVSESDKVIVAKAIGDAIYKTVGGELLDTEAVFDTTGEDKSLLTAELKTSYYSFTLPTLLGSRLAGVDESSQKILVSIGTNLGVAFQLADDLQGIFGASGDTGKPDFGDIREGKQTFLLHSTYKLASRDQKKVLKNIIGNPKCNAEMSQTTQDIMTSCGAKQLTQQKIQNLTEHAIEKINKLPINSESKETFRQLIKTFVRVI